MHPMNVSNFQNELWGSRKIPLATRRWEENMT